MSDETTLAISEDVTVVTVAEDVITVNIVPETTTVEVRGVAVSTANAQALGFTPHGSLSATNVQEAIQQLADQNFRSTGTPTGANVQEGDTWYDTDDNLFKVYRETSTGVFEWTNLVVASADDSLDAGAF